MPQKFTWKEKKKKTGGENEAENKEGNQKLLIEFSLLLLSRLLAPALVEFVSKEAVSDSGVHGDEVIKGAATEEKEFVESGASNSAQTRSQL
jgi:hypothetical protein